MDDAKYPAFDTKPYRIVKSRSEASVPVNVAPTYYIVASDLQGFPLQQAIPLVQMSTNCAEAGYADAVVYRQPAAVSGCSSAAVGVQLSGGNAAAAGESPVGDATGDGRGVPGSREAVQHHAHRGGSGDSHGGQPDVAGAEHTCVLRVDGAESRAARAAPDELRVSGECADVCEDSDGGVPLLIGN